MYVAAASRLAFERGCARSIQPVSIIIFQCSSYKGWGANMEAFLIMLNFGKFLIGIVVLKMAR